jgi:hypothetical protein
VSAAGRRFYTELHEGRAPAWEGRVADPPRHRVEYELGELHSVTYRKATTDGRHLYKHDFAPHARPVLVSDERGQLHVREGRYAVTTRGITDHEPGASKMHRYSQSPRNNPRRDADEEVRNNPSENEMKFWKDSAIVGATVGVGTFAGDLALRKTKWSAGVRGLAQALTGIAVGYALRNKYPTLGAGCVAFGVSAAMRGGATEMNLASYVTRGATPAPAQVPATATTATGTTAGASGLPSGARLHSYLGQAVGTYR